MTAMIAFLCASMLFNPLGYYNRLPVLENRVVTVPSPPEMEKLSDVLLTHYCTCKNCCGKTPNHPAYGITASGRKAQPYVSVAVDPDVIPLGSTVWLMYENGKTVRCRADDTGGAINGLRVDLCVSSHNEALELGMEYITVYWEVQNETVLLQ